MTESSGKTRAVDKDVGSSGYSDTRRWLMLAIVFLVGLFVFFNMFKAPLPLLPMLRRYLG